MRGLTLALLGAAGAVAQATSLPNIKDLTHATAAADLVEPPFVPPPQQSAEQHSQTIAAWVQAQEEIISTMSSRYAQMRKEGMSVKERRTYTEETIRLAEAAVAEHPELSTPYARAALAYSALQNLADNEKIHDIDLPETIVKAISHFDKAIQYFDANMYPVVITAHERLYELYMSRAKLRYKHATLTQPYNYVAVLEEVIRDCDEASKVVQRTHPEAYFIGEEDAKFNNGVERELQRLHPKSPVLQGNTGWASTIVTSLAVLFAAAMAAIPVVNHYLRRPAKPRHYVPPKLKRPREDQKQHDNVAAQVADVADEEVSTAAAKPSVAAAASAAKPKKSKSKKQADQKDPLKEERRKEQRRKQAELNNEKEAEREAQARAELEERIKQTEQERKKQAADLERIKKEKRDAEKLARQEERERRKKHTEAKRAKEEQRKKQKEEAEAQNAAAAQAAAAAEIAAANTTSTVATTNQQSQINSNSIDAKQSAATQLTTPQAPPKLTPFGGSSAASAASASLAPAASSPASEEDEPGAGAAAASSDQHEGGTPGTTPKAFEPARVGEPSPCSSPSAANQIEGQPSKDEKWTPLFLKPPAAATITSAASALAPASKPTLGPRFN